MQQNSMQVQSNQRFSLIVVPSHVTSPPRDLEVWDER